MILLNFYSGIIQWLEKHLLTCPSKALFHMECPGCGLQRGIIFLMKGDLSASMQVYPAALPILILFVLLILHLIFRFQHGAKMLIYMYIFCALIIMAHYIYKIINQTIF